MRESVILKTFTQFTLWAGMFVSLLVTPDMGNAQQLSLPSSGRVNIVIMLDLTLSTNPTDTPRNDLALEKNAARQLVDSFSSYSNRPYIAIGTFNVPFGKATDEAARILKDGDMTNVYGQKIPPTKLYAAISSQTSTTGYTDIAAAINTAQSYIAAQPSAVANFILLISDGTPNRPGLLNYESCDACGCDAAYNAAQAAASAAFAARTQVIAVHYAGSNPSTQFCNNEPEAGANFLRESIASGPDYFFRGTENLNQVFGSVLCSIGCDDGDRCTQDSCDSVTGECRYEALTGDKDGDGIVDCQDACAGDDSKIGNACAERTVGECTKIGAYQCTSQGVIACVSPVEFSQQLDRAACFGCVDADMVGSYGNLKTAFTNQTMALKASLKRLTKLAKKKPKALKILKTVNRDVLNREKSFQNHIANLPSKIGPCADTVSCYQVSYASSLGSLSGEIRAVESLRKGLESRLKKVKFKISTKERKTISKAKVLSDRSLSSMKLLPVSGTSCQ